MQFTVYVFLGIGVILVEMVTHGRALLIPVARYNPYFDRYVIQALNVLKFEF